MSLLCIRMEFQKITNFLDTTFDDKYLPRFVTEEWIEVYDQSGGITMLIQKLKSKRQC